MEKRSFVWLSSPSSSATAREGEGWALVLVVYGLTYLAAAAVPVGPTRGYCIDPVTRAPQIYHLNGFRSWLVMTAAAVGAVGAGLVPGDALWVRFAPCARAACALGLLTSISFYLRGRLLLALGGIDRRPRCPTADAPDGGPRSDTAEFDARSELVHWYAGLSEYNPRGWGGVDIKMVLYLVGAVMLQLNLLSACAAAAELGGGWSTLSPGLVAFAGCLTFFIAEYCANEVSVNSGEAGPGGQPRSRMQTCALSIVLSHVRKSLFCSPL